jgi:arginase
MKQTFALIGVPSSAGAHWPGQEKTPQYLRNAGLVARLETVGLDVIDCGDLPLVRFRPDREHRYQQNLTAVVEVCQRVTDEIDLALQRNAIPVVIGGESSIPITWMRKVSLPLLSSRVLPKLWSGRNR